MSSITATNDSEFQATPWWAVLIEGIALIILGLLFLANPGMSSVVVVQILGLYWFIAGILSIVKIFIDSSQWGWKLFTGILGIIAGILVLQHPLWSTAIVGNTLIILLGLIGIFVGIANIVQAFQGAGWGAGILGVIAIILGLALLGNVWVLTLSLPLTLGILFILGGIVALFGAFRLRSEEKAREAAAVAAYKAPAEPPAAEPVMAEAAAPEPEAVEEPAPVAAEAVAAVAAAEVAAAEVAEAEAVEMAEVVEIEAAPIKAAEEAAIPDTPGEKAKFHKELSFIEGIGPAYSEALMGIGIASTHDLLERGATRKGREEIAEQTGLSHKLIMKWVNHVDLYRVPGIGSEYADLLEAAGVDTVPELAQRNPENLHPKLVEVNEEKKLVRQVPAQSQVVKWVEEAKNLPRKVTY